MNDQGPSVCIITFGCQMNKLDSQLLRGELARRGFRLTDDPDRADVLLYNTCSVRRHAENRVLSHLGSWRRRAEREPGFVLGVIGCMAQRLGEQLVRQFGHVRLVCGTRAFLRVPDHLRGILAGEGPVIDTEADGVVRLDRDPTVRRTPWQAHVSVMRGCDSFCSYCIVPYVRGREASRPPGDVVCEVEALAADGVREVTLLGQNVNAYGRGLSGQPVTLADLLAMLNEVSGLLRIRFVTNHPRDVSEALLQAVAGLDKVCEHLHVPAQSGSDAVLARMRRGYARADYVRMPDVALASDFMVGFPGETDADFRDTLDLVRRVRFQQSFVFKYSPRPGTRAARWDDDVPDAAKRERNQALLAVQEQVDRERRGALVGQTVEVLAGGPSKSDPTRLSGRTRQNDIVVFPGPSELTGTLCRVRVTGSTSLTLFGEPADAPAPAGPGGGPPPGR
jgi:tRNA-2-methylthio-N6-dimethylallyladenosine synthase